MKNPIYLLTGEGVTRMTRFDWYLQPLGGWRHLLCHPSHWLGYVRSLRWVWAAWREDQEDDNPDPF